MEKKNLFDEIEKMNLDNLSQPTVIENAGFFELDFPIEQGPDDSEEPKKVQKNTKEKKEKGPIGDLTDDLDKDDKGLEGADDVDDVDDLDESDDSEEKIEIDNPDKDADYDTWSDASLIALEQIRKGKWDLDESEIPKDLDSVTLMEMFDAQAEILEQKIKEETVSQVDRYSEYIKFLMSGGNPETVQDLVQLRAITELDTSTEENQKVILQAYFELKQVDADTIEDSIEAILDKGKGKQKSEEAISLIKQYEQSILEREEEMVRQHRQNNEERYRKYVADVTKIVNSGKVGGIELSKTKQKQVIDAMFKPTERVEYINPETNKKEVTRVTKSKLLYDQVVSDPEKQVALTLWLLDGGTFETVKDSLKEKADDSLREILKGRRSKTVVAPPKKTSENGFEVLAERASRYNY